MTGGEDQAQQLVADIVVHGRLDRRDAGLVLFRKVAADLGVLAREHPVAPQSVDGPALGRSVQPGAGIGRNPGSRPIRQGRDEGILRQLLGQAHVAHHPGQAGDEPCPLDPEDRLDRSVGFGCRHSHAQGGVERPGTRQARLIGPRSSRDAAFPARRFPVSRHRRNPPSRKTGGSRSRSGRTSGWDSASPTRPPRPCP